MTAMKASRSDLAHAVSGTEPRRLPERLADDVGGAGPDACQRCLVRMEDIAVLVEQHLVLVAGFEDRAHLRFAGFKLRGTLGDAQLQRFVEPTKFDLGLPGRGDVMGDADEADVAACWIPAGLQFRAQPAPFAVGPHIASLQNEGL